MATTCSIDQLLLASIPDLPWPKGNYTKTLQAVVLTRDWKYDDTTNNVPNVLKGRMPTRLLVNGRLPLFKNEPGYLFYEGRETAMVMVVKGTMNINAILNAFSPPVKEVLKDGTFSLKDLLDLRHVSQDWPAGRQCVYLCIYTHPEDRPDYRYSDSSQADINKNVGFYVGSTNDAQRRKGEHENATNNPSSQSYGGKHYIIARKSQQQHRHMIPLVVFDANVPIHLLMMTEQTLTLAFRSYQLALFVPVDTRSSVPFVE
ncbi:hypothetical protein DER46DRAFT_573045 [Fusarium sp. MPI-SDFR-AT-0072]|nr:hypothetical protein DER46DRAFT_573045 [Fusarium sp. MPI-SDFR-AT-0072]